jgi:hypothetical protein
VLRVYWHLGANFTPRCQLSWTPGANFFVGSKIRKKLLSCPGYNLFPNKSQFFFIFEGPGIENLGIFYGHFGILRSFGVFYGHLVNIVVIWYIFFHFGILHREKSGNPTLVTLAVALSSREKDISFGK